MEFVAAAVRRVATSQRTEPTVPAGAGWQAAARILAGRIRRCLASGGARVLAGRIRRRVASRAPRLACRLRPVGLRQSAGRATRTRAAGPFPPPGTAAEALLAARTRRPAVVRCEPGSRTAGHRGPPPVLGRRAGRLQALLRARLALARGRGGEHRDGDRLDCSGRHPDAPAARRRLAGLRRAVAVPGRRRVPGHGNGADAASRGRSEDDERRPGFRAGDADDTRGVPGHLRRSRPLPGGSEQRSDLAGHRSPRTAGAQPGRLDRVGAGADGPVGWPGRWAPGVRECRRAGWATFSCLLRWSCRS